MEKREGRDEGKEVRIFSLAGLFTSRHCPGKASGKGMEVRIGEPGNWYGKWHGKWEVRSQHTSSSSSSS